MISRGLVAVLFSCLAWTWPLGVAAGDASGASWAMSSVRSMHASMLATSREIDDDEASDKDTEDELTLERLFPEKSVFGPSARSIRFSPDGRYAAYLYRPYVERRHGSDLWIYDTEDGTTQRITSVSRMAPFQAATREVKDDRIKKAKKNKGSEGDSDAAVPDGDLISGTWEGTLAADDAQEDLPDQIPFTLTLSRDDDGTIRGTIKTPLSTATVTKASFNESDSTFTCTLTDPENGLEAVLSATIEDNAMTGTLDVGSLGVTFRVEATRTPTATDDSDSDDDDDSETEDDSDSDEAEDNDDEGDTDSDDEIDEDELADRVDDDDADAEDAPRYGGVNTYTWAPKTNEMIISSGGDLYRYALEDDELVRLTRTREFESDVQYLPDGSGYTYLRNGSLYRISWNSHLLEQLDPSLDSGESMSGYRISPDGTRLVFLATKGASYWGGGRTVSIVNYRGRFAQVNQVPRHVSDDPLPKYEWGVYLYQFNDHMKEDGLLKKVYSHTQSGPRDILDVPEWSPDSSRIAFNVFEQTSGHVDILQARFEQEEADDTDEQDDAADEDDEEKDEEHDDSDDSEDDEPSWSITDAETVYRFLHYGGPNTPRMMDIHYLSDSRRLAILTEISGFRHVHVLDPVYQQLDQLTRGRFEVYPFDISEDHQTMFLTATKDDPAQEHVFKLDLESGEFTQLSREPGVYSGVAVSDNGNHVLANHTDFGSLRELVAIDVASETTTPITDSHPDEARDITKPIPEYFSYENRHGQTIHGHMFKPHDWTPDDKRPAIIYVYGGPLGTRKMVTRGSYSGPSYFFAYYMAHKHGYVTCTIDPRGASGYGGLFEKANYEKVGKPQVEDLVDGGKWMTENAGVDADRIGMHGWSFGGFQTQMCLYTEPDFFACGIAGAGPTEWENYNSWYSTGTIGPSRTGETDLSKFSLLPLAKNLRKPLLLIHGMEDANVLYQDTVRVYRELLKAGKETLVELFLDPTGGHGLGGDVKSINRYRKYEEFFVRHMGKGESAHHDDEGDEHDEQDEDGEPDSGGDPS